MCGRFEYKTRGSIGGKIQIVSEITLKLSKVYNTPFEQSKRRFHFWNDENPLHSCGDVGE